MSAPPGGLYLRWEQLCSDVYLSSGDSRRVLHDVSGQALPAELCACAGPSGSGKTSLFKLLAGRRSPSSGTVCVNGAPLDASSFRRSSGFVTQSTVFLDTLTVRETITFTALLRLDRAVPLQQRRERAEEVLREVDLLAVADTRIGSDVGGGISGGERRRLAIGVEVVHKPPLLLLDEPTSGLDATSAQLVGRMLRALSTDSGTTTLCTIHQPRAALLDLFDTLTLLTEGRVAYFGPVKLAATDGSGVLSYFERHGGFVCPRYENPADWLLDLVHLPRPAGQGPAAEASDAAIRSALAVSFAQRYSESALAMLAMTPMPAELAPPPLNVCRGAGRYSTSWLTQCRVLWKRTLLYKLREPAAVLTQGMTSALMPLIVGGIYYRIPLSQSAIPDRLAAISFVVLLQSFMCMDQILLFPKERAVYLRDYATGLYGTTAFYVARTGAEMLCATITYWMFGFQADAAHFFVYLGIICLVTEAGAALLASCGALSPSMEVGNILATMILIILTLLDGFYINLTNMPAWCQWASVFSFPGYGVQAVAANEFNGLVYTCTPQEAALGCIPDGRAYLTRLGFQHVHIGANVGYILVLAAGSRFVSCLGLHFLYTGQSLSERWRGA